MAWKSWAPWRGKTARFRGWCIEIVKPSGGDLYLSVRKDNRVACSFYERNGMEVVGSVAWKNSTIQGLVYRDREAIWRRSLPECAQGQQGRVLFLRTQWHGSRGLRGVEKQHDSGAGVSRS